MIQTMQSRMRIGARKSTSVLDDEDGLFFDDDEEWRDDPEYWDDDELIDEDVV